MGIWVEYLKEALDNPFRLGRHIEHDARNLLWRTQHCDPKNVNTIWSDSGPILNQGKVGSCTGDTVADILNTDLFGPTRQKTHNGTYFDQQDAYNFYHQATVNSAIGGGQVWPPNDVGSTGPAAAQAGVQAGYFDRYNHCFTWDEFCATLETQPVMLGTAWTNDMFNFNADGVVSVGSLSDDNVVGGHEYMARAILYDKSLVLCRNHWMGDDDVTPWNPSDDGVKKAGEFYLSFSDVKSLLGAQGDVTVPHGVGLP